MTKAKQVKADYRALIEDSLLPICRFLPDGTLAFANRAFRDSFGESSSFLDLLDHKDRYELQDRIGLLTPDSPLVALEHCFHQQEGKKGWYRWTYQAHFDDESRARLYQAMGEAMVRSSKAETWEQHRHHLLQADKMISLGFLVSGLAHEINNPSHLILSHVSPLLKAWKQAEPILAQYHERVGPLRLAGIPFPEARHRIPDMINAISNGCLKIKSVVNELREYSKESAEPTIGKIQINDVVRSAVTLLSNLLKRTTADFSVEYGENLPAIHGNARRLEQVVIDLVHNACQALSERTQAVRIKTCFEAQSREVAVEISDEGIGIPREAFDRLTDPFFTTKREKAGAGLGLYIASIIILEHGGRLKFSSEKGRGTTASIHLPEFQESNPPGDILPHERTTPSQPAHPDRG